MHEIHSVQQYIDKVKTHAKSPKHIFEQRESSAQFVDEKRMASVDGMSRISSIETASLSSKHSLNLNEVNFPESSPPGHLTRTEIERLSPEQQAEESKKSFFRRYRWKMTHYFYIHLGYFLFNGFMGGLIIWLIENRSSSRNPHMNLSYLDAWFTTVSTICSCGLTTVDFGQLSQASQIVMMCYAFCSGFAISTLPALIIKARSHRNANESTVDDDNDERKDQDELCTINIQNKQYQSQELQKELNRLPTATELRYRAYITCIVLILCIYATIYITGFIAMGAWLQTHNTPEYLLQDNKTLNPWYVSGMLTLFSFNQNGLTPFSTSLTRYASDVYMNILIVLLVMSGSSFFPIILRNVVFLSRRLAPWRHKAIFDYILLNNHHLSTLLYPTLQTRIYCCITILLYTSSIGISMILDFGSKALESYPPGIRFIIFLFQTINLRFCGFQSFDISLFATATIMVYLLLMATKPQMLCALDESPFEIYWLALETQAQVDAETGNEEENSVTKDTIMLRRRMSIVSSTKVEGIPLKRVGNLLRRYSLVTKELAKKEFSKPAEDEKKSHKQTKRLRVLRIRLFLIHFIKALVKHAFEFFVLTRTWLFVFIFLICAFEYRRMAPADPEITLLKIIFEIISAFGGVGMSLGYPNKVTSFSTVLSSASKVILIITMLLGRHRGLLASMKDQEVIEYSAKDILLRRRDEFYLKYQINRIRTPKVENEPKDSKIVHF